MLTNNRIDVNNSQLFLYLGPNGVYRKSLREVLSNFLDRNEAINFRIEMLRFYPDRQLRYNFKTAFYNFYLK